MSDLPRAVVGPTVIAAPSSPRAGPIGSHLHHTATAPPPSPGSGYCYVPANADLSPNGAMLSPGGHMNYDRAMYAPGGHMNQPMAQMAPRSVLPNPHHMMMAAPSGAVYMTGGEEAMRYMAFPMGFPHQAGYYAPQRGVYPVMNRPLTPRYDNSHCNQPLTTSS